MGFFDTEDNRWKNIRFKKLMIAAYALFIILTAVLVIRVINGSAKLNAQLNFTKIVIIAVAIGCVSIGVSYLIWRANRDKGLRLIDVMYPAGTFAACGVLILMHLLVLSF